MSNKEITEFKAVSKNLSGIYWFEETMGFKIPVYQRPYIWAKSHINRLIEDIMEDIYNIASKPSGNIGPVDLYTFLGGIIITPDKNREDNFTGQSYLIIDGQQRLTTLSLLACALTEWLIKYEKEITAFVEEELKKKRTAEIAAIEEVKKYFSSIFDDLSEFFAGMLRRKSISFPKIIQDTYDNSKNDNRSTETGEDVYYSDIAVILHNFNKHVSNKGNSTNINYVDFEFDADSQVAKNLKYISGVVEKISRNNYFTEEEQKMIILENKNLSNRYIKKIMGLRRESDSESDLEKNYTKIIDAKSIRNTDFYEESFLPYLRVCILAKYLLNNVVMTVINCSDENYAFSTFEKINTSGEPLTALETFKPHVIDVLNKKKKEIALCESIREKFDFVENYLHKYSKNTNPETYLDSRKKVSEAIVLSFGQYYNEEEFSKKLNIQRGLMKKFSSLDSKEQQNFVGKLHDICIFRKILWDKPEEILVDEADSRSKEIAKVCFLYLKSMRKTLMIPLLAKMFSAGGHDINDDEFLNLVKAITAFTILWRAYAGGVDGINKEYYKMLSVKKANFKKELYEKLNNKIGKSLGISNKEEARSNWIKKVAENSMQGNNSKFTAKFILLCAKDAGKERSDERLGTHGRNFLSGTTWLSELYGSIEHIAPQNPEDKGSNDISKNDLVDTMGNLTLLPPKINSAIGNFDWDKKKKFYEILGERSKEKFKKKCDKLGVSLSPKIINEIEEQPRLEMFDDLLEKESWESKDIIERSENMLALAFDELIGWLKDS